MPAVVLREELRHSPDGEVVALALEARSVVVDEAAREHGNETIVAQASLHDALCYMDAANMPRLASFDDVELVKAV